MVNVFERARSYISRMPNAVAGDRGHDKTLAVACTCVRFALSDEESMTLLREFNARCDPPWKERELLHKLESARAKAAHEEGDLADSSRKNGQSHRPQAPAPQWRPTAPAPAPATSTVAPQVFHEVAALDLPEPIERGAVELLRALYQPDEHVRIVQATIDEADGREKPVDAGISFPVREWLQKAEARNGELASIWTSSKGAGVYVGMNPVRAGGTKDEDVTSYRFALVESDSIPVEEQYASIVASRVPMAALIDSGGKSLHAWVRVEAKDRREYDERVAFLRATFPWADPKNTNPARLSRLPDAKRKGRRQRLLGLNHGTPSWFEWQESLAVGRLGPARTFGELLGFDTSADPGCVIGFRDGKTLRYLCKGKSAWLLGPSGVGKSSLQAQFAVGWAIGAPVFGITPARPLRSLIVQAENDDYDLAEMVQGVASAHGLAPGSEGWDQVAKNVLFRTETSSFGPRFCARLRDMIKADRPDVVWIDPLLSFAGVDVSKQDQVTPFLRADLTPILEATGVVMIGVHHTGKPKDSKATRDWTAIDWAYAGIGSSELVNWARAVMLLRPVEGRSFELKLAKRGSRAGATHPDGEPAYSSVWIRQAIGRIYWEQELPPEEPAPETPSKAEKPRGGPSPRTGAPSKVETALGWEWLAFTSTLPSEGVSGREFVKRANAWMAKNGRSLSRPSIIDGVAPKLVETHRLGFDGETYFPPTSNPSNEGGK